MRCQALLVGIASLLLACSEGEGGPVISTDTADILPAVETLDGENEICTPNCDGKECGPNGCGGECGTCKFETKSCTEDGQCIPTPCDSTKDCPGALVCEKDQGVCVVCVGDEDCPDGEICGADHECHQEIPCQSDLDCKNKNMVCDKEAGKCVECLGSEECPEEQYCLDTYCVDDVCTAGESHCDGLDVVTCNDEGSAESVTETCTDTQYCEEGACLDLVCTPDEQWCDNDVAKLCASDGKTVESETDCTASEQFCLEGKCVECTCMPGQTACYDDFTVSECADDCLGHIETPCEAGKSCLNGDCIDWLCEPGTDFCDSEVYKVCSSNGLDIQYEENCAVSDKYCSVNGCIDTVCPPMEKFCLNNTQYGLCAADGMSYQDYDCLGEHYCDGGECLPWVCTPGEAFCEDNKAKVCDAKGSGVLNEIDCGDSVCTAGECVNCIPQCSGKDCGEDDCGGSCGTCGEDETCTDGICQPDQLDCDGDGEPECPDLPGYIVYCNEQEHCEYAVPDATGWEKWNVWIWVRPGQFPMGSPEDEEGHEPDEEPVHVVTFAEGYWIGKYEVTVGQYEACMSDNPEACTAPWISPMDSDALGWGVNTSANGRSEHPQNGLNWYQADAFCAWVIMGGRLPSEAEWEYAASGPNHRKYPWGNAPEPFCVLDLAVFDEDGTGGRPWGCSECIEEGCSGTSPVGSAPEGESYVGALDMAGNAMELCADNWFPDYIGAPVDGSPRVDGSESVVARGAAFSSGKYLMRCSWRSNKFYRNHSYVIDGARCALSSP